MQKNMIFFNFANGLNSFQKYAKINAMWKSKLFQLRRVHRIRWKMKPFPRLKLEIKLTKLRISRARQKPQYFTHQINHFVKIEFSFCIWAMDI